jgi:hypothetical protein
MKFIIFFSLALVVACAFVLRLKGKQPTEGNSRIPNILNGAKCVLNEKSISTKWPVPLHGRVDQVFELEDGRWLPLDTKVRERVAVYPSDIVQLSVYALILKYKGHRVCPFGVLRFPIEDAEPIFVPVKLYSETRIVELYQQYISIQQGGTTANCTCGKHLS